MKKNFIKVLIVFVVIVVLIIMMHLIGNSLGLIKNHFGL